MPVPEAPLFYNLKEAITGKPNKWKARQIDLEAERERKMYKARKEGELEGEESMFQKGRQRITEALTGTGMPADEANRVAAQAFTSTVREDANRFNKASGEAPRSQEVGATQADAAVEGNKEKGWVARYGARVNEGRAKGAKDLGEASVAQEIARADANRAEAGEIAKNAVSNAESARLLAQANAAVAQGQIGLIKSQNVGYDLDNQRDSLTMPSQETAAAVDNSNRVNANTSAEFSKQMAGINAKIAGAKGRIEEGKASMAPEDNAFFEVIERSPFLLMQPDMAKRFDAISDKVAARRDGTNAAPVKPKITYN